MDEASLLVVFKIRNDTVLQNIQIPENPRGSAFFRQQRKSVFYGFMGISVPDFFPVKTNDTFLQCSHTKDVLKDFCSPRTYKARDSENFSGSEYKRYILYAGLIFRSETFHF